MAVAHKDRIDRLNLLKQLIPRNCSDQGGPDARQLLARLAEHYEASKSDAARMRAIQRDLDALVKEEEISVEELKELIESIDNRQSTIDD